MAGVTGLCNCPPSANSPPEGWNGLRFCALDGEAWACWHDSSLEVKLGSVADAAAAMVDFQRQTEVGQRLHDAAPKD